MRRLLTVPLLSISDVIGLTVLSNWLTSFIHHGDISTKQVLFGSIVLACLIAIDALGKKK